MPLIIKRVQTAIPKVQIAARVVCCVVARGAANQTISASLTASGHPRASSVFVAQDLLPPSTFTPFRLFFHEKGDLMRKEVKEMSKLPQFRNEAEATKFFYTHDLADYWDDMAPVENLVVEVEPPQKPVSLRLPLSAIERLKTLAASEGISYQKLIQKWILQKLQ